MKSLSVATPMHSPLLHTEGGGPDLLFIHGTGRTRTDIPVSLLSDQCRITTYDRRGSMTWPLDDETAAVTVERHAADALDAIARLSCGPIHVCGLSFGGVIALEAARQRPECIRSLALFEPPITPCDFPCTGRSAFVGEFNALLERSQPEAAAELFYRRVMTDAAWDQLPGHAQVEARARWPQIANDLRAKSLYRISSSDLRAIHTPVLLLCAGASRPGFAASTSALARCLPSARVETIPRANHAVGLLAWPDVTRLLLEFVSQHHDDLVPK